MSGAELWGRFYSLENEPKTHRERTGPIPLLVTPVPSVGLAQGMLFKYSFPSRPAISIPQKPRTALQLEQTVLLSE